MSTKQDFEGIKVQVRARRPFTDTGNGGADGPRVRFTPAEDLRTVRVSLDEGPVVMRRVDLLRLRAWLDALLGAS